MTTEKLKLSDLQNRDDWERAVVVFKQESFDNVYDLESRSYEIVRDNKYFKPYCIGSSLFGNCLDGKDNGVRLDWYMHDAEKPWRVDYCYIVE